MHFEQCRNGVGYTQGTREITIFSFVNIESERRLSAISSDHKLFELERKPSLFLGVLFPFDTISFEDKLNNQSIKNVVDSATKGASVHSSNTFD